MNQFTASLWGDEAFSAILSTKSVKDIISIISRDTSPPLFNLLEHFWFKVFGSSEIAIRALTFGLFLIAIFFVYKIGRYYWDRQTGILAGALTFLNPFFFTYAFEGRMYSLLAATVTASMYFFITKNWVGYILATTLALYSHHFAIFAVLVQGLWFFRELAIGNWKLVIPMLKAFAVIALAYIPWLIPLYSQTKMVAGGFWLGKPTLVDLRNLIYSYLAEGIKYPLAKYALWGSFLILILRKWTDDFKKTIFLLSWFLVPILTTWAVSQKMQSIFFDRYMLYTIPGAMLILASGRRKASMLAIGLIILLFMGIDGFYFTHPVKRPFRQLATYVKEVKKGDDYLVNWNAGSHHLWESKYYGIPAPLYIPSGKPLPFFVGTALMTKEDVINTLPVKIGSNKTARVGVITSGSVDDITIPSYSKGEVKSFGDLKFVWFVK